MFLNQAEGPDSSRTSLVQGDDRLDSALEGMGGGVEEKGNYGLQKDGG